MALFGRQQVKRKENEQEKDRETGQKTTGNGLPFHWADFEEDALL
jgi:hypothetical protein